MVKANCKKCGKEFKTYPSRIKVGKGKYCSQSCSCSANMTGKRYCLGKQLWLGRKHKPESIEKMREANKGKRYSAKTEFVKGQLPWNTGKKCPWTTERNLTNNPTKRGPDNPMWKGGLTSENSKIRTSDKYQIWRKGVFERDNHTCQKCGVRGGHLHAHHKKPFSLYPELRLNLDNGETLCKPCHKETDSFAGKIQKLKVAV